MAIFAEGCIPNLPKPYKVTQEQIDQLIDSAETQEAIFWDKELVVSFKLVNGFSIIGRAACVDPKNFDLEIGRKIAKDNAKDQLWQLEGYLLQNKLYLLGLLHPDAPVEVV